MPTRRPGHPFLAGAPLLIAHRGGAALAPENTLAAFRAAVEWWRADVLELDVQPTRDGEAVVFHDATLERTTDGTGPVAEYDHAALAQLDAGHHFSSDGGHTHPFRSRGVRISSLAEVLEAFPGVRLNVEIKDARAQHRVRDTIREAAAEHRVLIAAGRRANRSLFSAHPCAISASGEELRSFYVAFRMHALALQRLPVDALQLPERWGGRQVVTEALVRAAHARNLAVHVWTVDEEADMRRLLGLGVDGIVTDRPDRLGRVLHATIGRPLPPGPPDSTLA